MASRQAKKEAKQQLKILGSNLLNYYKKGDEILTSIGVDPAKMDVTKKEAILAGTYAAGIAAITAAEGSKAAKKQLKKDGVNLTQKEFDKLFSKGSNSLKSLTGVNLDVYSPNVRSIVEGNRNFMPSEFSVNVPAGDVGSLYGRFRPQDKYKEFGFRGSRDGFSYSAAVSPDAPRETLTGGIGYKKDIFDGAGEFTAGVSANKFEKKGNIGLTLKFAKGGQIKKYSNSSRKPKLK